MEDRGKIQGQGTYKSQTSEDVSQRPMIDYAKIIGTALDGFWVADLQGRFLDVNDSSCRMIGYTRDELLATSLADIEVLETLEETAQHIKKLVEQEYDRFETCLRHKDGQIIHCEISAKYSSSNGGQIIFFSRDITGRVHAEDTLRKSEAEYRLIVENANVAIIIICDGLIRYFNQRFIEVGGYSRENLISKPFIQFIHPDDREMLAERHGLTIRGEQVPGVYPFRILAKDGRTIWAEINAVLISWEGKPATLNYLIDITKRKLAEDALRESEQRFRRLAENAPDVILRYEFLPQRHYSYISTTITAISGYTPEEYYADPNLAFKLIHPNDMALLRSLDRRDLTFGMPEIIRLLRKDRAFVWVEQRCIPIYDKEGKLVAIEAIIRDITGRKQAEDILLTLATSSPVGIYTVQDGKFQYANPRFQELLGYSEDELFDMHPLTPVFFKDVALVRENAVRMLRGEQVTPYEFRYITKGGEVKWALERVASINLLGKRATLGSFMDITQRKLMEEELHQKEAEMAAARETDRLKNQLLSTVSHELRTPLASIKGYSTLLLDYNRRLKRSEQQESLTAIDKSADRLTELINHLLDMSRLEAGLLKLDKIPDDVSGIIKAAVYEAQLRAPKHQISSKLEDKLPKVNIDGKRIRQVLDNLLDNSVKYSQEGAEIVVKAWQKDKELVVSVADQGIGIPVEELDKVFNRMYRIEQRLSQDPGRMGLGLSLCKALVEGHGGRIWLKSLEGKGSTFYFALPIETKDVARDKN